MVLTDGWKKTTPIVPVIIKTIIEKNIKNANLLLTKFLGLWDYILVLEERFLCDSTGEDDS